MNCGGAVHRLLGPGVPATVEYKVPGKGSQAAGGPSHDTVALMEAVEKFIPTMDTLKLTLCAVDQIHPYGPCWQPRDRSDVGTVVVLTRWMFR